MDYYKVPYENLVVIYDYVDLDVGHIRIRAKGGAGTHNGMRSIISHTKQKTFRVYVSESAKLRRGWIWLIMY